MNSVRSALRGAGEPEVVPRCTVMPSVRSPDRGLLLSYGGEAHGKQETDRDAVRLSGGGAVQHRRAVHQADPLGGMAINGARTAIALVVIGAYLAVIRHPLRFNRWVAVGALSIFGTNALFSVANKLTTAANVIVLQFTAPIFVILFSALFWRRKPGRLDLLACGIVFGGVLFFFADSLEMGGGLGNVLALLSGVAYAGVFLMNEMPDSDAISSVFWGDVLSAVTGLPFLLGEEKLEPIALTSLLVLGVFQVAVAYILLTIGLKTTPPVTASLVSGIEPVLNPILVAVFYHETVGTLALAGAATVIVGVVGYNVIRARQSTESSVSSNFSE